jgi:hypothetical protein
MPKKVTVKDIKVRLGWVNDLLQTAGSDNRIHFEHRYDYYALESTDADGTPRRSIKSGTKREMFDALYLIEEGIRMVG